MRYIYEREYYLVTKSNKVFIHFTMKLVTKFHIFDSIYKMSRKGNAQGQSRRVVGSEGEAGRIGE